MCLLLYLLIQSFTARCVTTVLIARVIVEEEDSNANKNWKPSHETSSSQEVKQLTTEDLPNHTIHDVIMPLPGWNIEYPAGDIGELYGKILKADDLDAHKMRREQRYAALVLA